MKSTYWPSSEQPDFYNLVHYTLAYGTYEQCIELLEKHGINKVKSEFLKPKAGLYDRAALGFAELILEVKVSPSDYIKDVY